MAVTVDLTNNLGLALNPCRCKKDKDNYIILLEVSFVINLIDPLSWLSHMLQRHLILLNELVELCEFMSMMVFFYIQNICSNFGYICIWINSIFLTSPPSFFCYGSRKMIMNIWESMSFLIMLYVIIISFWVNSLRLRKCPTFSTFLEAFSTLSCVL